MRYYYGPIIVAHLEGTQRTCSEADHRGTIKPDHKFCMVCGEKLEQRTVEISQESANANILVVLKELPRLGYLGLHSHGLAFKIRPGWSKSAFFYQEGEFSNESLPLLIKEGATSLPGSSVGDKIGNFSNHYKEEIRFAKTKYPMISVEVDFVVYEPTPENL